jgi:hypothetical protein
MLDHRNLFEESPETSKALATLRLIGFALMVGAATFAVIALTFGGRAGPPGALIMLRVVWAALLVNAFLVPVMIRRSAVRRLAAAQPAPTERSLVTAFMALAIMSLAMVEAPSLLGGVTLLLSGDARDMIMAGVPLLAMPVMVRRSRWENFSRDVHRERERGSVRRDETARH